MQVHSRGVCLFGCMKITWLKAKYNFFVLELEKEKIKKRLSRPLI